MMNPLWLLQILRWEAGNVLTADCRGLTIAALVLLYAAAEGGWRNAQRAAEGTREVAGMVEADAEADLCNPKRAGE